MTDHIRTEKIGGDSIYFFVVIQVERKIVMTRLIAVKAKKTVGISMAVQSLGVASDDMALRSSSFTFMPSMALTDNFSNPSRLAAPLGLISLCYTLTK